MESQVIGLSTGAGPWRQLNSRYIYVYMLHDHAWCGSPRGKGATLATDDYKSKDGTQLHSNVGPPLPLARPA